MRWSFPWLVLLLFGALAGTGAGTGLRHAHAHAALLASTPADGATLAEAPARLELRFNEPVSVLRLRLVGAGDESRDLAGAQVRDGTVIVPLGQDTLAPGSYALSWRVISADGHPVGGSVVFALGGPLGPVQLAGGQTDQLVLVLIWVVRVLTYLGLFVGVGGAAFVAFIVAVPGRAVFRAVLLAGGAASVLAIGLQGLDVLAAPPGGLLRWSAWVAGVGTSYGRTAVLALLALALALLSLLRVGQEARWFATAALGACGAAFAASGHASEAPPHWLTRSAVFVHTVGVTAWVGALLPLAVLLRQGDGRAGVALRRFGAAILPVVAALSVAGGALAVVQLGAVDGLNTAYGRLLLLKLGLVCVLLLVAGLNRVVLTPAFRADPTAAAPRFSRSIAVEGVLVLAILGVVAGWRFTPPPRAAAAHPTGDVTLHIHTAQAMANLVLSPGRAGSVTLSAEVMSADMAPLVPKQVGVFLANPAAGIEPIERQARLDADGIWRVSDLVLPTSGRWQVRLDLLVSEFQQVSLDDALEVRPSR